jgi:hypothetical protein
MNSNSDEQEDDINYESNDKHISGDNHESNDKHNRR